MKSFWQDLPKPFFVLAPMEAVTDTVFRHVVANAARPDVFFTEFTNAASYCSPKGEHSTRGRLLFTPDEQPMVAQIWGTNPENFAQMAKGLKEMGFAGIDINMGCPDKQITKKGSCAALIENPPLAAELIAAAKEGGLPVSVKTRVGFKYQKTEEWISFLLKQDIVALTVHARTAKEMSKVPARWEEVAKAVKLRDEIAPQTLIIGNGDVVDRQDGLQKTKETGVDGIMIGRGIFHNPFCFEKEPRAHSREELLELLNFHLDLWEKTWDDSRPYAPLKRFFKIYIRDFPGAHELRAELMDTKSIDEARRLLQPAAILAG
ncbi:MAG: tRNA dihydrouridine synthase [Candidatus Saccharimonadales bacterium]